MSQNINASVRAIEPTGQHSAFQQKSAMEKNGLLPGTKNGPSEIFANALIASSDNMLEISNSTASMKFVNEKISVNSDSYFGIGTTDPNYQLHLKPPEGDIPPEALGQIVTISSVNGNIALLTRNAENVGAKFEAQVWIASNGFLFISSDSRIKKNIVDVPDNLALEQLRSIPCRYYEYIDTENRGTEKTIGFIAQEVKSVMPMAVSQEKEIIPNIYKVIDCTWTGVDGKFTMSSSDLPNVSGIVHKFYVSNDAEGPLNKEIILTGNEDNTFTFDKEYEQVFCYGSEVDDFNILDKQKLFTLAFSATQEIDRIQQSHATEIASLKTQVAKLTALLEKNNIV